ncbi:MAG: helix-turn-helix domain-containing protein [Acidimicrobiia bacterium]|nr:helix-turn-helix domain-containing protein [Acidimicrobiia bacterium]
MTVAAEHRVLVAIQPLLALVGGEVLEPGELQSGDVPVSWDGEVIGGIRLESLTNALDRMVTHIEQELGGKIADLSRKDKQAAVRMLDERGAFQLRRAIEDVAAMMGVSRITIYNYLNAIRSD